MTQGVQSCPEWIHTQKHIRISMFTHTSFKHLKFQAPMHSNSY